MKWPHCAGCQVKIEPGDASLDVEQRSGGRYNPKLLVLRYCVVCGEQVEAALAKANRVLSAGQPTARRTIG